MTARIMSAMMWNLWHGCHKVSEGCFHCYVYRRDAEHGIDSSLVRRTASFGLPLARRRDGSFKVAPGTTLWTCFTSDFFLAEADEWRPEAWSMMRRRPDVHFVLITKRVERVAAALPADWGEGYHNVTLYCTVENGRRAAERLPVFRRLPFRHKAVICEPLLEYVDLRPWLGPWVELVTVGGESGPDARPCDFAWVCLMRDDCRAAGVPFFFKQTGACFVRDGRTYRIPCRLQMAQARKAGIDTVSGLFPDE